MTATIYLIRHGTIRANREERFVGRTDEPLHAEGGRADQFAGLRRKVLLCTHLIVARCLILHYSGRPPAHFRLIKVDNGDVSGFDGLAF
ncbi:MAG: histidine phosphatase family protein [Desulfobulbaceae bacterium]|nr:histidine phosphatase family protein [Desulfobulbaceae bacterium]